MKHKRTVNLLLGPILFALSILLIPASVLTLNERVAIGTVVWMAFWWITMPIHITVTGLLPVAINAVFLAVPMNDVLANYSGEIIVLFMGADLIGLAWSENGLDKRLALKALCLVGPSATRQIIVWFLVATVFSMFLANIVVVIILTQMALAMLKNTLPGDVMKHEISYVILLCIAWGAGIGGMGTPLGGTMNLIPIEYIETYTGQEFMYGDWMTRLLPFMLIITVLCIGYMLATKPKGVVLEGTKEYFQEQYAKLPPLSSNQIISVVALLLAVVLSFVRDFFGDFLPGLKPAYIFMLIGLILFFIPKKKNAEQAADDGGSALLNWESAEHKLSWGLYLMFAGGLAAGNMVSNTGAAMTIGELLTKFNLTGGFGTILLFVTFAVVLAEVSSNTASAAITVPIVMSVAQALELNPISYIFITSVAFNIAYMLPTSIRAVPIGNGVSPGYMFKRGLPLTVLSILLVSVLGLLCIQLWPYFGTL